MKLLICIMGGVLMLPLIAFGQANPDPGLRDSVIIDSLLYYPWEWTPPWDSLYIRVWAVTDDSVDSYNIPLTYNSGGDGIFNFESGVQYFPPVSYWDEHTDTLLISERFCRMTGQANLDSIPNYPLLTNSQRVSCWRIKLHIEQGSRLPIWMTIDTTFDSQNGSLHFGIRGYGNIIPAFRRGGISLPYWWPSSTYDNNMQDGFSLGAHPNPFNAQTLIQYNLPGESDVSLTIFDILGRQVETLIDGYQTAGPHQVIWNADNSPSGIYFYRLKADNTVETKRMTLIR
jgi:hypothetical protein